MERSERKVPSFLAQVPEIRAEDTLYLVRSINLTDSRNLVTPNQISSKN
jgi:hypothetical protein